ncbi:MULTISPECIES: hypothetical protein [Actinoalloteichus]|uniref:Uncharacterized protein n=1 Tax=Actinoalloteichus fjordicus TaxID=1612552 RepID=A0AAC9PQU3_9PSEU|nr:MULTISPECIES: hypothetical protein [Actinoalloteichus]APU13549.1 hypothetical protein UA74_07400 [Actinoalloteichus fjordicus]APU19498.1 hypothetical protein UA75_07395 [Actinoalloteichus sp. GBA129-24]
MTGGPLASVTQLRPRRPGRPANRLVPLSTGPVEWFVRSVCQGDTHHGQVEYRVGSILVRPACGERSFAALNSIPIRQCYYDDQECRRCLALIDVRGLRSAAAP